MQLQIAASTELLYCSTLSIYLNTFFFFSLSQIVLFFLWFLTFKNEVIVSLAQMAVGYDKTAGSSYCEAKNGLLFR